MTTNGTPLAELDEVRELFVLAEEVQTEKQFLVFWLHYHEGLSQRQIAQALGIARTTVQSRLESGRARLVEALKLKEAA